MWTKTSWMIFVIFGVAVLICFLVARSKGSFPRSEFDDDRILKRRDVESEEERGEELEDEISSPSSTVALSNSQSKVLSN